MRESQMAFPNATGRHSAVGGRSIRLKERVGSTFFARLAESPGESDRGFRH